MLYALNENVYLVDGRARSCIYDFNSSKLYNLNAALADEINAVNNGEVRADSISGDLGKIFSEFVRNGVFIFVDNPVTRNISEIGTTDSGITFAWIEITNKCNLRCRHCYNESDNRRDSTMNLHDYKIVIDCLMKLGVGKIQLIGGEPFQNREILRAMLDYTVGKFEVIEIFTNGTMIDENWVKFLAVNNIRVAVSIYSYAPAIHDNVTGCAGSWDKTNATVEMLRNHGVVYRVCNVLMNGVEIGRRTTDLYSLSDRKDIVRMTGRANFSLLTDKLIRRRLITRDTFKKPLRRELCGTLVSGHNCFNSKLYIAANMEVFPCVMERRISHGVIEDGKFNLDDAIRKFNKDRISECRECEYRYACFDCRPNSLSGNLFEKPWYCTYEPLIGKWREPEEFIADLRRNFE